MRRAALLLVVFSAVPAAMQAQSCIGQAPWSSGSMKVGGSLEIGDGYTDILGGIGFGKDGGFFFGAGAGIGEGSQVLLGAGLGKELSTKLADKVSLCPVANVQIGLEKDEYSYWILSGGLSGGYPLSSSSTSTNFVLTGAFQLGISHASFLGVSNSDVIGILDAGVGLIFNERISVVPGLRLYFGEGSDVAFTARANIAIGKKGP
jgi:hypothetical protein